MNPIIKYKIVRAIGLWLLKQLYPEHHQNVERVKEVEKERDGYKQMVQSQFKADEELRVKQAPLRYELDMLRKDREDAAGELMINIDDAPPGSVAGKLLAANVLIRRQRDNVRAELADTKDAYSRRVREINELLAERDKLRASKTP